MPKNLFSFNVPSDLFTSESNDWQQAALTLDLPYFCMGDLLTAVNKRHWIRVIWQQTQRSAWNNVV